MNKAEFVESVRNRTNLNPDDAAAAVDAMIDIIVRQVHKGETVRLVGFGVFEAAKRAKRTARNIRTGEPVKVKAKRIPAFRPSPQFKDVVAGTQKIPRSGQAVGRGLNSASVGTPAKKTPAKKTSAKKTSAKKTAPVKAAAKKTTPRKAASSSRAPAKKTAPVKAAAKKTTPRK